jgi:glycosidase
MWGADDPDERKPLVWSDLRYDDETTHPFGRTRPRDRVVPDTALFRVYQEMIALRKEHLRLFVDGEFRWLAHDDARGTVAYERALDGERAVVLFNTSKAAQTITLPLTGRYRRAWPAGGEAVSAKGTLRLSLPPRSARVFIGK